MHMKLRINEPLERYLEESEYIDWREPGILTKASEALREGVGICWTKANLLAAHTDAMEMYLYHLPENLEGLDQVNMGD